MLHRFFNCQQAGICIHVMTDLSECSDSPHSMLLDFIQHSKKTVQLASILVTTGD